MNNDQHFKYGTFINGDYKEHATLEEAAELFDSSVSLGVVETGSVIGWFNECDYETLYDQDGIWGHDGNSKCDHS